MKWDWVMDYPWTTSGISEREDVLASGSGYSEDCSILMGNLEQEQVGG